MKLYRYSVNGIGIYEAFKMESTFDEWKYFLSSPNVTWLPKPEVNSEYKNLESWFTEKGNKIFIKKLFPMMQKKFGKKIKIETYEYSGEQRMVYSDEYQVVLRPR